MRTISTVILGTMLAACSGSSSETFDDCEGCTDGGGLDGGGAEEPGADGSGGGDAGADGSAGDGSAGDGSAGDGSAGLDAGADGSAGDGSAGDGSAGDGGAGLDASAGDGGAGLDASAGDGGAAGDGSAGDASAGLDGGGSTFSCVPGDRSCATSDTLAVCSAEGDALHTVTCDRGCVTPIDGAPQCNFVHLGTGWSVREFPTPDDPQPSVNYVVSDDGNTATQTINGVPSVYINDQVLRDVVVTGRFSVQTTSDDDLMGFVFGYQDDGHYYLLDWKKATQNDSTCNSSEVGISLKRVSSDTTPNSCDDFWGSIGTEKVTIISPASANAVGWASFTNYDFVLRHSPGDIAIEITTNGAPVAAIQASDATYAGGQFGFYNYSQSDVRYEFFRFEPRP